MNRKIIAFDFDGTLADSYLVAIQGLKELSKKYGYGELSQELIKKLREQGVREFFKELSGNADNVDELIYDLQKQMKINSKELLPFSEIPAVLNELTKIDFILGIISSNDKDLIKLFLKNHNLEQFFNFILTEKEFGTKSDLLAEIINQYNISNTDLIYVGDDPEDIEATKKVRCKSIAVGWGNVLPNILSTYNPDVLVRNPGDLVGKIKQLTN